MLIAYIGDDGRGVVKEDFRGPRSKVLVCELGQQLAPGQRELCKQEKWEIPFLFAPWIYGLGSRSCVTSARGEGIYWAFPWWMTHRGRVPAQPPPIRLPCDNWPLSASLPPYPFFSSFPSSPTNFIYPETVLETHWWGRQHRYTSYLTSQRYEWSHW